MRRILLVLAVVGVWVLAFLVTLASTESSPADCNDNPTIAAACAMPGPSLLPALPVATLAAAAILAAVALLRRRRRAG